MFKTILYPIIILLMSEVFITSILAQESEFKTVDEEIVLDNSHIDYLQLYLNMPEVQPIPYWIRSTYNKMPGDYFRIPEGADSTIISAEEVSEISNLLTASVVNHLYNDMILNSVRGYEYSLLGGKIHRREYHIYYAQGDTIYVISGWLGKFLSFYRAVPGEFRYDVDELNEQVRKLSPTYRMADKSSFKRIDDKGNYLLEYIDRENMMRVRNYLIYGTLILPGSETGESRKYNLIEITKFIDKEVMP